MAASPLVFSSLARRAEKVGVSTPPRVLLVAGGQNLACARPVWAAGWAERASSSPGARRDAYAQGRFEGKRANVLLASGGDALRHEALTSKALSSSAVVCIYMMIIAQALGACAQHAEPVKGSVAVEVVLVSTKRCAKVCAY